MDERTQFTFYSSFFEAISRIKKKADRADAYDAICAYALRAEEPDLSKMSDAAQIAFLLSKPNLDSSRRKAKNGKEGGSKKANGKQTGSKPEANSKQEKPAREKENEKEKEKEKEYECTPPTPSKPQSLDSLLPEYAFADALSQKIRNWVKYKQERKEGYKEQGLKSLLTQIQKNALKYGDAAVIDLIDLSMSNGWKGIIWDKLAEPQRPVYAKKPEVPKGCGELGDAELEAIQRVLMGG